MIHGLAGSAALMLLIIPTIESRVVGLIYIVIFGPRFDWRHDDHELSRRSAVSPDIEKFQSNELRSAKRRRICQRRNRTLYHLRKGNRRRFDKLKISRQRQLAVGRKYQFAAAFFFACFRILKNSGIIKSEK